MLNDVFGQDEIRLMAALTTGNISSFHQSGKVVEMTGTFRATVRNKTIMDCDVEDDRADDDLITARDVVEFVGLTKSLAAHLGRGLHTCISSAVTKSIRLIYNPKSGNMSC